ncbi:uncharacterized protein PV07_01894 [Cladophialophora immunda]|uniref:Cyclase n=1 Tax=Cladophialophora immunda TaxID=569365 RepID=A0A0D2CZ12_9EURO|nr:uncharacterized protein PV07_01894 [Cladophialophora immunda]KIW35180.1 hypothetical protein PV07_01894 [Cladophialophora immunda]OQV04640.1 hypothetical protein CLAIMM_09493 [Cladophialophora immunda]
MASSSVPDFDSLPPVAGMPPGCAWGVFDKDGQKDVFGTLNRTDRATVLAAATEIKQGISISLNWRLGAVKTPAANRKPLEHRIISFMDTPMRFHGYDDEHIAFNTQCSSQWDSLCHFYHQESASGYNGCQPTSQDLIQGWGDEDNEKKLPTLNHWHDRGGLVGRGVLIDFKRYAEANGIESDPFGAHEITVSRIEEIAAAQGVTLQPGDVFIIRTGYTEVLEVSTPEKQKELMARFTWAGVEQTIEAAKWFWNKGFAAVASDNIGFEVEYGKGDPPVLHPYLLSLFGMPIGELWDLKALSKHCAETGRYSFFFTSITLNVPGAVGSPPNALAIF